MVGGDTLTTLERPKSQQLRTRAVLYEADRADDHAQNQRGRKHQPILLALVNPDRWPLLAAYLLKHQSKIGYDGWPPGITRSSAARRKQLDRMHAAHGPLALVRLTLLDLEGFPLKSPELKAAARVQVDNLTAELLRPRTCYSLSLHRASATHAHMVNPVSGLLKPYSDLLVKARPGTNSLVLEGRAHVEQIVDSEADYARTAQYLSDDPNSHLRDPNGPGYFDALESELLRKATQQKTVRLAWTGSTPSK